MGKATPMSLGMAIDRYVVERELGRGATAVVYLARDRDAGRMVALKVMRDELVGTISTDRFFREIRRTAELSHPNILPLLASGEFEGRPFCVLPFMDGGTLRQRLDREKQLPIPDAVTITVQVARALAFAHGHNLVHRDVKPENILFTGGQATLADFGIARALERSATDSTTSTGIVRGTPAYMSPEQAMGETTLDGRTDVYSLGCVLYEMLAGMPAFVGPTAQAVLAQRISHSPRPVHVYRPSVPIGLQAVLDKALATSAADRYRNAEELAAALDAVDLAGTPASTADSTASLKGRRWWPAIAVASLAVVAALAFASGSFRARPAATAIPDGDPRRVAVLYLDNRSPDALPSYLVDGISEDLTNLLAGLPPLVVSSSEAVRGLRAAPIPLDSMGRMLRAGTLIGGSARATRDSITIVLRLIGAQHGELLGSDSVTAPIALAYALPGRLVDQVGVSLRQRLGNILSSRAAEGQTRSRDAWDLAQRATALARTGVIEGITLGRAASAAERYRAADRMLARAESLDATWGVPSLKRARLAVSQPILAVHPDGADSARYFEMPPPLRDQLWKQKALGHVEEALRRQPDLVEATALRASILLALWRRGGADSLRPLVDRDVASALARRPSMPLALFTLAELRDADGRYADAVEAARLAYEADAFFELPRVAQLGFRTSLRAGRFDDARDWCRIGLMHSRTDPRFAECGLTLVGWTGRTRRDVDSAWALLRDIESQDSRGMLAATRTYRRLLVAAVAARAGLRDSARSMLDRATVADARHEAAYVALLAGDRDEALRLLEEHVRGGGAIEMGLLHDPWFVPLRDEPRFRALVATARATSRR
jgi:serine/threonine-protein kinase